LWKKVFFLEAIIQYCAVQCSSRDCINNERGTMTASQPASSTQQQYCTTVTN